MNFDTSYDIQCPQNPRATQAKEVEIKRHSLCGYVRKITVNPRIEQFKTVVIGVSVRQRSFSWEGSARLELASHQWNTNCMRAIVYLACGNGLRREG